MTGVERRHRRATVMGLGLLTAFALGPLLSAPLGAAVASRLGEYQHLGALCLAAVHALLTPVQGAFHLVLMAGLLYGAWDRALAWRRHDAIVGSLRLQRPAPDSILSRAAEAAGLTPSRVALVHGLPTPALTIGWFRPRVLLAAESLRVLSAEQLVAVLAHESAHVRRRDPARLFAMRFVAKALFWLPLFRRLADDLAEEVEILADDEAARAIEARAKEAPGVPGSLVLAEAIVTLASAFAGQASVTPRSPRLMGVGMLAADAPDLVERRVRRLMGESVAARSHVRRSHLLTALLAVGLFWTGLFPTVHPLEAQGAHMVAHCEHLGWSPFAHLICRCDEEGDALVADARAHCEGMH
ncbi:MAG: M48 family metalloprotease [Gemmatimonadales bacterium]|nr:M48 family metalloprotease [Gemmatimonadales bacterium]